MVKREDVQDLGQGSDQGKPLLRGWKPGALQSISVWLPSHEQVPEAFKLNSIEGLSENTSPVHTFNDLNCTIKYLIPKMMKLDRKVLGAWTNSGYG